jgi:membrane associated rhomboid family serine protease
MWQKFLNYSIPSKLIAVNIVLFLLQLFISFIGWGTGDEQRWDFIFNHFNLPLTSPDFFKQIYTLITFQFLHAKYDISHILFNMLGLYYFSSIFINFQSPKKVLPLYLWGGVFAGIMTFIIAHLFPHLFLKHHHLLYGASASVFAILAAAATISPDYPIILFLVLRVKLKYLVYFTILISFIGMMQGYAISSLSHLMGLLLGYLYVHGLWKGINIGAPIEAFFEHIANLMNRSRNNMKVIYRNQDNPINYNTKSNNQEQVDKLLDKIRRSGYESLTEQEKRNLNELSNHL